MTKTSTLDVTVSFDGIWLNCSFKSSHRVEGAMSVDTGKILDAVVISKTCTICEKHASDKSAEKFEAWQMQHQQSGQCEKNFDGPNTNMETEAAKILWAQSLEMHNMQYLMVTAKLLPASLYE